MATEPSAVEQAVTRTLRENLESIQRTSDELHRAVGDFVAACASSRSLNALPPMIRAQMSAASLAATLEVLTGLVTAVLQPSSRGSSAVEALRAAVISETLPDSAAPAAPIPIASVPLKNLPPQPVMPEPPIGPPATHVPAVQLPGAQLPANAPVEAVVAHMAELVVQAVHNSGGLQTEPAPNADVEPIAPAMEAIPESAIEPVAVSRGTEDDSLWAPEAEASTEPAASPLVNEVSAPSIEAPVVAGDVAKAFDIASLPVDQQELHRRANRVAKVSMQDIKMLRPDDVRLGRENRDLCTRLRDDIEKAHKEYDRRFQSILSHPVDYFYNWMVEILAGGESEKLGEYPYHSAVPRR